MSGAGDVTGMSHAVADHGCVMTPLKARRALMPRRIGRIKWYVGAACVAGAVAATSAMALAQGQSAPSQTSSHSGAGPGTVNGPDGQFVPGSANTAPTAPAGSTTHSSKASGSGRAVKSYSASPSASVRHGANAAGPSLHSSDGGSGPGTQSGPDGQFVPADGSAPPAAPAGSTTYSSNASGSGEAVKSHQG